MKELQPAGCVCVFSDPFLNRLIPSPLPSRPGEGKPRSYHVPHVSINQVAVSPAHNPHVALLVVCEGQGRAGQGGGGISAVAPGMHDHTAPGNYE